MKQANWGISKALMCGMGEVGAGKCSFKQRASCKQMSMV
jgi:hypothetical protein